MSNGKKKTIFIILAVLVVLVLMFMGYFVYSDLKQEELLKQEIVNVSNKDLVKDDFKISVVTSGDYAYVEESIKKFYLDLSNNVKDLENVLNNENLANILSVDNMSHDGPEFIESLALVEDTKKKTNDSMQEIINLCDEKTILNLLDKEKVDDYYIDFYKELMYTDSDKKEFEKTKQQMQDLAVKIDRFLDKVKEMLEFLKANKGKWQVQDGKLYFDSDVLINEYNKLYDELQKQSIELNELPSDLSGESDSI